MRHYFLFVVVIFIISGCVTTRPTAEGYKQLMDQYVGIHASELEDRMGYPDKISEAFNGDKVYVYDKRSSYTTPVKSKTTYTKAVEVNGVVMKPAKSETKTTGGDTITRYCTTYFTINKSSGIVEKIRWEGNSCKAIMAD